MDNQSVCPICTTPAHKTCTACNSISYCSVEHQKSHWKIHKKTCMIYEVKTNEIYGRYTIATRDISPGTIIMNSPAIMIGPKQVTLPICLGCNRGLEDSANISKIYHCTKCRIFPMCGRECENMPIHAENECLIFSQHRPNIKPITNFSEPHPAYECIMTLRCLLLKKKDPKKWKKLLDMQHHSQYRKENLPNIWHRNQVNTVDFLRNQCQMSKEFSEEEIHNVLGYYDINAFEVQFKQIAICGLFKNTFLMSHDCVSNTHHSFTDDFKMVVRASTRIAKGEMITTAYDQGMEGTVERRLNLKESKYFDCNCRRCKDPTELGTHFSSVRCRVTGCPGFVIPPTMATTTGEWSCMECGALRNPKEIDGIIKNIKARLTSPNNTPDVAVEYLEKSLKLCSVILHPNHYLIIGIEASLLSLYGRVKGWLINDLSLDDLARKESLARHILSVLDVLKPGLSRTRGGILYELQVAIYYIANRKFDSGQLSKEEFKQRMEEVLGILQECQEIFLFDSINTLHGTIAQTSIPASIAKITTTIANL